MRRLASNLGKAIAEHCPRKAFFVGIFVMHIVSSDFTSG
jgi:hypothetical protein